MGCSWIVVAEEGKLREDFYKWDEESDERVERTNSWGRGG